MLRSLPLLSLWPNIPSLSLTCLGLLTGQEQALCGPVGGSFLTAHLSVYTEVWGKHPDIFLWFGPATLFHLPLELAAEDGGEGAMLSSLFGKLLGVSQEKIRLASITDFRNRWGSWWR